MAAVEPKRSGELAVVVVNFRSHQLLADHLGGLAVPGLRTVVVDSFSDDIEQTTVAALCDRNGWDFVPTTANRGFAHGVNLGVRRAAQAGSTTVVLLNPDAVVSYEVLLELGRRAAAAGGRLVAPSLVDTAGHTVFAGSEIVLASGRLRAPGTPDGYRTQPWLTAACVALPIAVFDALGGLDESYFLYWEDVDLSYRAAQAGFALEVCTDLVAVHDEGGTQHRAVGPAKSRLYYRYNTRNRLLFAARNLPTPLVVRWLLRTPGESVQILLRGGRRQLMHSWWPLVEIARGAAGGTGLAVAELARRAWRSMRRWRA